MKNIYTIMLLSVVFATVGCTDRFDDLNTNPKVLTSDKLGKGEFSLIFKRFLYKTLDTHPDTSFQLGNSLFSDIYANYFATTAENFDSDQYVMVGRWLNGAYYSYYSAVAPQIKFVEDYSKENKLELENAMVKVWKVYFYHRITDYWGSIPYSQFGNFKKQVPYDSQEAIYRDFFEILDEAITTLSSNAGETSFLGSNDVVFEGSVGNWLKFANSLRLRLAMRVKYVDSALSKSEAEKSVSSGIIDNNSDNAFLKTAVFFGNPYNLISQWGEYRMSADMESILKGYKDPRVASYFAEAETPDATDDPEDLTFNYEGMRNGQTKLAKSSTNFNDIASDMAAPYKETGGAGPNIPLIRASEVFFLRAEGALEGWAMNGTAQELYESGINASLEEHGFSANLLGAPYTASTDVPAALDASTPAVSTVPIAFNISGTKENKLEQIITQKWIALYPESREAFAERRRTGYPILYDRLNSLNPNIPVNKIPRRLPYVSSEATNNTEELNKAISEFLGGENNATTKLWWDKK